MKFQDYRYERFVIDPVPELLSSIAQGIRDASGGDALMEHYDRLEKFRNSLATAVSYCHIRHTVDTRDPFYDAEFTYYDEYLPAVEERISNIFELLLASPHLPRFEKELGPLAVRLMAASAKTMSPEIVGLRQRENALMSEYITLTASAAIAFDGKTLTLSQLSPYKMSTDEPTRRAAFVAEGAFYESHGDELDRIFDELVRTRDEIAKKLGYSSFTEVGYLQMGRVSYTRADIEFFRRQIAEKVVPAVSAMNRAAAGRLGLGHYRFSDSLLHFAEGNPSPKGTPDGIMAAGRSIFEDISPETREFITMMFEENLFDVLSKEGKATGGYCTELPDLGVPYVFANFNTTQTDVEVITHECGHAFAFWSLQKAGRYTDNSYPGMDIAEIHSMGMEKFCLDYMDRLFREDADKYLYTHIADALIFWPYGSMVDHFQHIVYDEPDLTPAQRHERWLELEALYRPDADFSGIPWFEAGGIWQAKRHIYLNPFYYIDYCLAQYAAVWLWFGLNENRTGAWDRYMALVGCSGLSDYPQALRDAGIPSPFEGDPFRQVVDGMGGFLAAQAKKVAGRREDNV